VRDFAPIPKAYTTGLITEVAPGRLLGLTVTRATVRPLHPLRRRRNHRRNTVYQRTALPYFNRRVLAPLGRSFLRVPTPLSPAGRLCLDVSERRACPHRPQGCNCESRRQSRPGGMAHFVADTTSTFQGQKNCAGSVPSGRRTRLHEAWPGDHPASRISRCPYRRPFPSSSDGSHRCPRRWRRRSRLTSSQ